MQTWQEVVITFLEIMTLVIIATVVILGILCTISREFRQMFIDDWNNKP